MFDPKNPYQQFEITNNTFFGKPSGFKSKSVAPDGVTTNFLTRKGWKGYTKPLKAAAPTSAAGLNAALRARLPDLADSVEVGKWYCPFIFVRDGEPEVQVKTTPFYEMTLRQRWEEVFACGNVGGGRGVDVDVFVGREVARIGGEVEAGRDVVDGVVWFGPRVGLSSAIVERVRWEEERAGFQWGGEKEARVKRREEYGGAREWTRFRCYVLVERFVLKRIDGSLVLSWEFRHTHQVRTKWE